MIEKRYQLIEQSGFFSGEKRVAHQRAFIQALFAYDEYTSDAFNRALSLSYSLSWHEGAVEPLSALLNFIRRVFFDGPSTEDNKQAFFEAVLTQHRGESNALSHTAWIPLQPLTAWRPLQPESNPLNVLLNALIEAGIFSEQHAVENKQKFINGVFATNKNGENALYNALKSINSATSKNEVPCPNIKLLLDALAKADCFNGPSAESNKQAFIDAIFSPDRLGRTPLYYASRFQSAQSLKLIYDHLKQAGCFTSVENKQKLIDAIFAQTNRGESALSGASHAHEGTAIVLNILTEAGCFDGPIGSLNQQNFVNAVFAEDENGMNCLYYSLNDKQILNQLIKIKYFEGPYAEQNKGAFIKAVLAPTQLGKEQQESALSRNCTFPNFPFLIEHLTAAGCFSGPTNTPNKQAFINAVFAKEMDGESMLSSIHEADSIILLLKKLEEAGCFDNAEYKKQFRQAVRHAYAILFYAAEDLTVYLALHKSLLLAEFSAQEIKELLNESITQKYGSWSEVPPLMMADEAELTTQQKQQVEQFTKTSGKPEKPMVCNQPTLGRRVSLSDLSLFAEKQSNASSKSNYAADDTALIKSTAAAP